MQTLLESERERIAKAAEIEISRMTLDAKRYELELHELERRGEESRKNQVFAERLKEQRRESMARAREIKKQKQAHGAQPQQQLSFTCEECAAAAEGRAPTHASDLIRHATERHAEKFFRN